MHSPLVISDGRQGAGLSSFGGGSPEEPWPSGGSPVNEGESGHSVPGRGKPCQCGGV